MKNPMLGIIGICLLQVAFVAYNAIELPVDISAVTPVSETAQVPADLDGFDSDIVVFRSGKPVSKIPAKVSAPAPSFIAVKREHRIAIKPTPIRPRAVLAIQRPRIRTEYPISPLEYSESNKALSALVVTKQAKKKSFFSKALPLIKKPYDWAKAFAGKLK